MNNDVKLNTGDKELEFKDYFYMFATIYLLLLLTMVVFPLILIWVGGK